MIEGCAEERLRPDIKTVVARGDFLAVAMPALFVAKPRQMPQRGADRHINEPSARARLATLEIITPPPPRLQVGRIETHQPRLLGKTAGDGCHRSVAASAGKQRGIRRRLIRFIVRSMRKVLGQWSRAWTTARQIADHTPEQSWIGIEQIDQNAMLIVESLRHRRAALQHDESAVFKSETQEALGRYCDLSPVLQNKIRERSTRFSCHLQIDDFPPRWNPISGLRLR